MILFVDDEPAMISYFVDAVSQKGLPTRVIPSAGDLLAFLDKPDARPTCIVLDPGDTALPNALTATGMTAGMPIFAAIRSKFPDTPVIVLAGYATSAALRFFQSQANCSIYLKSKLLPSQLAYLVEGFTEDLASKYSTELGSLPTGQASAKSYETLCTAILKYLFAPPFKKVIQQARRLDGHNIRDAILPNNIEFGFFWGGNQIGVFRQARYSRIQELQGWNR